MPPTWQELVDAVRAAQHDLTGGNEAQPLWYRGQPDASWKLTPSLFRLKDWDQREAELFEDVSRHADRVGLKRDDSEWKLLCEMQHHRIPTRLLDWTETFGVALFFALRGGRDSAIYVLNPARLNDRWEPRRRVQLIDAIDLHYEDYLRGTKPVLPLAAKALFDNDRMFAQQAVFTVQGSDTRPLDEILSGDVLRKLELTGNMQTETKEFFKFSNINAATVFPDIVGLAGYLRKRLDLDDSPQP